ncbi:hypothetical protein DPMN_109497 [Dreissena polymorpha]|uniref:Uncharacterized protein n=1 Tax=Dreissena polymorpha TaxID=45954 RepID=A0A9D4KB55_DREPO|nr:hypothetical protein DPMN_109497 [Dreissena polymorpha]
MGERRSSTRGPLDKFGRGREPGCLYLYQWHWDRVVIKDFQGSSVAEQTDRKAEINTISPRNLNAAIQLNIPDSEGILCGIDQNISNKDQTQLFKSPVPGAFNKDVKAFDRQTQKYLKLKTKVAESQSLYRWLQNNNVRSLSQTLYSGN